MKRVSGSRRGYYLIRVSIFLAVTALIAGMPGCDYTPPASENLEIRTWHDLDAVRDNLDGNHKLMNDLDSTTPGYAELASAAANGGKGWQPIGDLTGANLTFTGTFDGQGCEIRDLFINLPDETRVGLFSLVYEGGVIKNLGLTNVTVICRGISGGLAGTIDHCTISNSYVNGNLTGDAYVGGLVGTNFGNVINCHAACNVTCEGPYVGGLIGANMGAVSKCYSTGSVTSNSSAGGLVGQNGLVTNNRYPGTVRDSYSTASVTGEGGVGGLVGFNWDSVVSSSYSTGSVTGNSLVGGLVGVNAGDVTNSYSIGSVTGSSDVGGLVGCDELDGYEGTVTDSFWDTETSGQAASDGGTGKTTAEMQAISTFSGVTWDIVAVAGPTERNTSYTWNIVDDVTYPFLSWQA